MMSVLQRKLQRLLLEEEGVALVVTLALFMFLYVSCAGVFAIGRSIKNRVLLQNAADAAAYSAAIVEADTLSRISAINRAMAWTYKDMILRQHDYILLTWLKKACDSYKNDIVSYQGRVYGDSTGTMSLQMLVNDVVVSYSEIQNKISEIPDLEREIKEDSESIDAMYNEELNLLRTLPDHAKGAVRRILEANLSGEFGRRCLRKVQIESDYRTWATVGTSESDFLNFDDEVGPINFVDEDVWFPPSDEGNPICRCYTRKLDQNVAMWWYRPTPLSAPVPHDSVWSKEVEDVLRPFVSIGTPRDKYTARPMILKPSYFPSGGGAGSDSARGTISVSVAHRSDNPWTFGSIAYGGIYDAFQPYSEHTRWMRAISSAQAGYRAGDEEGSYSVRWLDEGRWNLGTNDWDAVYVPVRSAFDADAFKNFVEQGTGWDLVLEDGLVSLKAKYDEGVANATKLPQMHNNGGSNNRLEWGTDGAHRFLDLMFH